MSAVDFFWTDLAVAEVQRKEGQIGLHQMVRVIEKLVHLILKVRVSHPLLPTAVRLVFFFFTKHVFLSL